MRATRTPKFTVSRRRQRRHRKFLDAMKEEYGNGLTEEVEEPPREERER